MVKISIVIPCRNEEKYIEDFLHSVLENDYPKEFTEIIIVDGNSTDNTLNIIERFKSSYSIISVLNNKEQTTPNALNIGFKYASGDYIIRLDVHSIIPKNYFTELINYAQRLDADNIGTVVTTDVKNKNPKSCAIKKVLSNKFGVGNSYFRIGINKIIETDTVPFGCFKKEIFCKIGYFNKYLDRDQDIELNKRIKKNGGKIFLIPNISSTYFARENYSGLAINNFSTGMWNILTIYVTKKIGSISLRHLVPLFFILSLIMPIILFYIIPEFIIISILSIISYLALISSVSVKLVDSTTNVIHLIKAFIVLHFTYGIGSFVGLFRINYLLKND